MESLNLWNDINALEPKCKRCNNIVKIGETTTFDEKRKAHVCSKCGELV